MKKSKRGGSKKKSKSKKDLSDGSDEEIEKKPRNKSRLMRDLSDESDEEVQQRGKKKPKSRKGGVIFDSGETQVESYFTAFCCLIVTAETEHANNYAEIILCCKCNI